MHHSEMASEELASHFSELDVGLRNPRNNRRRMMEVSNRCHRDQDGLVMEENFYAPHLPDEVMSTILAFLPLMNILKVRLVGKRWNVLTQEQAFRNTYRRVSGELSQKYIGLLEKSRTFQSAQVSSCDGGLLLLSLQENGHNLFVVDPKNAITKEIPPMLLRREGASRQYSPSSLIGFVDNVDPGKFSQRDGWSEKGSLSVLGDLSFNEILEKSELGEEGVAKATSCLTDMIKNAHVGIAGSAQETISISDVVKNSEAVAGWKKQKNVSTLADKFHHANWGIGSSCDQKVIYSPFCSGSSSQKFKGKMVNNSEVGGKFEDNHFTIVGLVKNATDSGFKILVALETKRPVQYQVYDSTQNAWQWTKPWTVRQPWACHSADESLFEYLQAQSHEKPVSFNTLSLTLHREAIHCLAVSNARDFHILRLDTVTNQWHELQGLFPPNPFSSRFVCDFRCRPVIFESSSSRRLMLASAQVTGTMTITLTVWEYNPEALLWKEVASAYQKMVQEETDQCRSWSYADNTFFYLHANGDNVCLGAFPTVMNPDPKVLLYSIVSSSDISGAEAEGAEKKIVRLSDERVEKSIVFWNKRAYLYEPRHSHHSLATHSRLFDLY